MTTREVCGCCGGTGKLTDGRFIDSDEEACLTCNGKGYFEWKDNKKLWPCIVCGKQVTDYVPQLCCDGRECGCRGLPIDPPVCSPECWKKLTGDES